MIVQDPYATGVLQKEHHDRLVADLENFARDAGIRPQWVWTALPDDVQPAEKAYLVKFRHHLASSTVSGLCYSGDVEGVAMEHRLSALAGFLVRNFVRARVMTLGTVIEALAQNSLPELTAILIPNFFLPKAQGGHLATWQVQNLFDFLSDRFTQGLQTIVYVSDMDKMGHEYGLAISRLIKTRYVHVTL